jgi:hypothetical protein
MPVGSSTATRVAPALVQQIELGISIDDFATHRESLKRNFSEQYGLDAWLITLEAWLITLEASAGSVVMTVTIATESSKARANWTTIEQRVAAVDGAMLATSISAVVGANVSVAVTNTTRGTIRYEAELNCPRGKWCTAGLIVACTRGTYNPLEDQEFATACIPCPPNSNTLGMSSTTRGDCICNSKYFDANMTADVVQCTSCPVGTDCTLEGSTLNAMPLRKGFYRLDATSLDVHMCPDARKNCSATNCSAFSTSGCQGGTGDPCANNLTGVFCQLCNRSDLDAPVYYKSSTANAVARCVACGDTIVSTILVGVAIIVAAALAALLGYMMWQRASPETIDQLEHINNTCSRKQAQDPVCLLPDCNGGAARVRGLAAPGCTPHR